MWSRSISLILLTLAVYGASLSAVFFTIGAYSERLIVQSQANNITKNLDSYLLYVNMVDKKIINKLKSYVNINLDNIKESDSTEVQENKRLKRNKKTIQNAMKFFLKVFTLCFTLSIIVWLIAKYYLKHSFKYRSVIKEALVMMILVVIIQTTFSLLFAVRFQTVNKNDIMYYCIEYLTE